MTSQLLKHGIIGLAISALVASCAPDSTSPAAVTVPNFTNGPHSDLVVDDDGAQCAAADYTTIQAAVVASSPGDVIQVCAGLYPESVNITHTLTLLGAKSGKDGSKRKNTADPTKESIIQPPSGVAISVAADDVVIDGFNVVEALGVPGIFTSNAFSGYVVRNNIINSNPDNGVGLNFNSADVKPSIVERNYFDGHSDAVGANEVDGIFSNTGLHNATIRENTFFHNNSAGIVLLTSPGVTISNVIVEKNTSIDDGSLIALFTAPGTVITQNEVVRPQGSGIFIGQGNDGAVISHNKLSDGLVRGIKVDAAFGPASPSSNLDISHNDVRNMAGSGIMLAASSANNSLISHNDSRKNGEDGIRIESGNSGNTITHNKMKQNAAFDARDITSGGGTSGTANFWIKNQCGTSSPGGLCK